MNLAKTKNSVVLAALLLSGCDTMGHWAHDTGQYIPLVGERCQNWQCLGDNREGSIPVPQDAQSQRLQQNKEPASPAP